jgi:hypothetical protein
MAWRSLAKLEAAELVEAKPVDQRRLATFLTRAEKDLKLARDVVGPIDAERGMAIAYEAAFRACLGLIIRAGYRVRSGPGHHLATIEGAAAALGPSAGSLFRRIDAARRFRNQTLYDVPRPAGADELKQLIKDADEIIGLLRQRV